MNPGETVLCATTARWLAATSAVFGSLGLGAAAAAVLLLLARVPRPEWAGLVLLLLLPERVLALRTAFDAGLFADLFADLAQSPANAECRAEAARPAADGQAEPLRLLDAALASLGLRPPAAEPRSLLQRVQGARRLSLQHAGLVSLQCLAVALLLGLWVAGGLK